MNPFLRIFLVLYWILWMAATAQAQDKTTEFAAKVAELLKDYYNFYPTEKIHLTTDKQYYVDGDKIWLQAFVTYDALFGQTRLAGCST